MQYESGVNSNLAAESWKSSHIFTGDNPVFPVDMFVALMEYKHKEYIEGNNDTYVVKQVLNQIPNLGTTNDQDIVKNTSPAAIWKAKHIDRLLTLNWSGIKQELLTEFGQRKKYDFKQKLDFLYSSRISAEEDKQCYLIRLNMIVSYIEHGKICDQPPNSVWVRLLYMVAISNEPSEFLFDNTKDPDHYESTAPGFPDNSNQVQ